ncbi:MAG TPA: DUF721 domain-containing protein [Bacteroidales bacterium]|nr:DUF721 domain-containing protein [Bacteroidales bacterium]
MRRKNTESLRDVLAQVLKQNKMDMKLYETRVIQSWPVVLGENIRQYTTDLYFSNKKLYVKLSSSVLRQELFLAREEIIKSLNRHVGADVVTEIVFQ